MTLYERCEKLFTDNHKIVKRGFPGRTHSVLGLISPAGDGIYSLYRFRGDYSYYSICPPAGRAGDGSFIYPEGGFTQGGSVTEGLAAFLINKSDPVRAC